MSACRLHADERPEEFGIGGDQRRRNEPFLDQSALAVDVGDDLLQEIGALYEPFR